jgi:hypothetical protein
MSNNLTQLYLGHDGESMINNQSFYFANYFDWIGLNNKIIKKMDNPRHIYLKTEYLKKYSSDILDIKNDFILITACSDASPFLLYPEVCNKILELPNLKKWFTENNIVDNPKVYSLSVGFASLNSTSKHGIENYENFITNLHNNIDIKKKCDKIFSCFRSRNSNICGNKYLERPYCHKLINNNIKYFDTFQPNMNSFEFLKKISEYKWAFCPLGNGIDHSPKLIECLFLKVIPIVKYNKNSYNLYHKYPIIWIEDFDINLDDILKYDNNINWDYIPNEFTCDFWYNKIIN